MTTFNAVVGNPPYQEDSVSGSFAVYHHFMSTAQHMGEDVSLIYPARWLTGGQGAGLDVFRENELSSENYVQFVLHPDMYFFENVLVSGGVNYFLWEQGRRGSTRYVHGNKPAEERITLLDGSPVFIGNTVFSRLYRKVRAVQHITTTKSHHYGTHVASDYKIYRLADSVLEDTETVDIYFSQRAGGIMKTQIPKNVIDKDSEHHKVFLSRIASICRGKPFRRPARMFVGYPGEVCSSMLLTIPGLKSEEAAENMVRYLKTDFATFLFGIMTPTQDAYSKSYQLIPAVDPATGEILDKPGEHIDFTVGTVDEIDDQLAEIYGLTDEERELMRESRGTWKDKNSLTADGLY